MGDHPGNQTRLHAQRRFAIWRRKYHKRGYAFEKDSSSPDKGKSGIGTVQHARPFVPEYCSKKQQIWNSIVSVWSGFQ